MSPAEGIAYGAVQGLTEFLPVSSSGHLVLFPWVLGWEDPGLAFSVALHLGTLIAVLVYFRRDWWRLAAEAARGTRDGLLAKLVLATIPAVGAGLLFQRLAETAFRSPLVVAGSLAGFGVLLAIADRSKESRRGLETVRWGDALWIGAAQSLAILPGVSRSGVTITAARFLGIDRDTAARFSFLLGAPIIAGAAILEVRVLGARCVDAGFALGIGASAIFGALAIGGLLRLVRRWSYAPFVAYRIALAAIIVGFVALR